MKRMLINATQPEEMRVALVDGQRLYDLDIESTARTQKKSNIYKGRVVRIEPSLEAAFIDYGGNRHGFLPLKEISRSLFKNNTDTGQRGRISIKDAIEQGQELIVQIEKEERGNKGAALTTMFSLAGRYMVLMPNNPRSGGIGISRQIEGADRADAREVMSQLDTPKGVALILRTAGIGKVKEEFQWDTDYLITLWQSIEKAAAERRAPFLIYQESDVIIRAIRDYLRTDIEEIWIDDKKVHQRCQEFMQQVMPHNLHKLKFFQDSDQLFTKYQIEGQIDSAFSREVRLPSGGSLIIDHTEALVSIDINSGRATKGCDIEETALNINMEASEEIARQLRLRDLGGLIVIDFIDMVVSKNQRKVENRIKECLRVDRARVQVGKISRFGLLEMSRQRLRPSLGESRHLPCPRCDGQGTIRDIESISLAVLRILEEEAMKDSTAKVIVNLPVSAATFLLNEKRQPINELQQRLDVEIVIIPSPTMETPQYQVQRVRLSEASSTQHQQASYNLITEIENDVKALDLRTHETVIEQPAVKHIIPRKPVEAKRKSGKSAGIISRLIKRLFGAVKEENKETEKARYGQRNNNRSGRNRSSNQNRINRNYRSENRSGNWQRNPNRRNDQGAKAGTKTPEDENTKSETISSAMSDDVKSPDSRSSSGLSHRGRRGRRKRTRNTDPNQKQGVEAPSQATSQPDSYQAELAQPKSFQKKESASPVEITPNTVPNPVSTNESAVQNSNDKDSMGQDSTTKNSNSSATLVKNRDNAVLEKESSPSANEETSRYESTSTPIATGKSMPKEAPAGQIDPSSRIGQPSTPGENIRKIEVAPHYERILQQTEQRGSSVKSEEKNRDDIAQVNSTDTQTEKDFTK